MQLLLLSLAGLDFCAEATGPRLAITGRSRHCFAWRSHSVRRLVAGTPVQDLPLAECFSSLLPHLVCSSVGSWSRF